MSRRRHRTAVAGLTAGWLAAVIVSLAAPPAEAALPLPSLPLPLPSLPLPSLPLPLETPAPTEPPKPTQAPKPTVTLPLPTLPLPTLPLPTPTRPAPTPAATDPSESPMPTPTDRVGGPTPRPASAAPSPEPTDPTGPAAAGPATGGGPSDTSRLMPGDRAEDHASGQPDLMTGILVPAATIAVSGTLIAILLMAQVMGGLAFVPVLRRAIGPAAVGRWRRRRDRAPGA